MFMLKVSIWGQGYFYGRDNCCFVRDKFYFMAGTITVICYLIRDRYCFMIEITALTTEITVILWYGEL